MDVRRVVAKISDESNEPISTVGKIFRRTMIKLAAYPIGEVEETLKKYSGLDEDSDPVEETGGNMEPEKKEEKKRTRRTKKTKEY